MANLGSILPADLPSLSLSDGDKGVCPDIFADQAMYPFGIVSRGIIVFFVDDRVEQIGEERRVPAGAVSCVGCRATADAGIDCVSVSPAGATFRNRLRVLQVLSEEQEHA